MRRSADRRIAIGAFALAALVLVCTGAVVGSPEQKPDRNDPAAARELVALMRAGEREHWLVASDFTRTLADGRTLRQRMREGRTRLLHVLVSGTAMTVERGNHGFVCNLVEERSSCNTVRTRRALPASEVLRVAVSTGAYGVTRESSETIAGERARCFRVFATGNGRLIDLGAETDLCFAGDGIPLSQRIVRPADAVDERIATSVRRGATPRAIEQLERSFGPSADGSIP